VDAVRFLDVFLEHIPETVISGWDSVDGHGNRVLRGYLGLLSAGTKFGDVGGICQAVFEG
jgi:pre-rRNA-processing protein IPI1